MRIHLYAMVLAAAIVAGATTHAFAQTSDSISVSADKESYSDGETIMITGEVANRISGIPVVAQIMAPNGNVIGVDQVTVGDDGTFSFEAKAGGPLWLAAGEYTIRVQYGSNRSAEATVDFGGSQPGSRIIEPARSGTMYNLDAGEGGTFDVGYSITGGSVTAMSVSGETSSLTITIAPTDDGQLSVTLPREVIDAKMNVCSGQDDNYVVLVDRGLDALQEQAFTEDSDDDSRTLTIGFPADSESIEIIGTCAVPEFGAVAVVVLAVAVVAIVAVTARSRLSLARY